MKTKEAMIKELKDFIIDIMNDCMPDITETNGIVIVVYSPNILGSDDGMWHHIINTYEHDYEAIERYHNTRCTDSIIVTWTSNDDWNRVAKDIEMSINNMIFRLTH